MIVFASDHAGFALKNELVAALKDEGVEVLDCGVFAAESCDYPDYAKAACAAVLGGQARFAVLVCGTGIGMSMSANKLHGIRAACCSDVFSARYSRLHNDANTLCIGARVVGGGLALDIVRAFLSAEFEGGRHQRRVDKIMAIEKEGV